jgi:hypothetical protein
MPPQAAPPGAAASPAAPPPSSTGPTPLHDVASAPGPPGYGAEPGLAVRSPIAAPGQVTSQPKSPPARCALREATPPWIGVDIVPFVGTSSFTGLSSVRRLSLNVLGGGSAGIEGIEIGGLVNVTSAFTCGVELAGLANISLGPVVGAQVSGLVNFGRGLEGAQIGLVNVSTGAVRGAQVGLVNVAGGAVTGVQVGLVNVADTCSFCLGLVNVVRHGSAHRPERGPGTGDAPVLEWPGVSLGVSLQAL